MSEDTNKDNVVNLNQSEPDTEASEQAHIVPYTQISNEFLRDPSLPPETRLLLVYLLSFAPRWKFHDSVIRKEMGVGRDKLERMFRELRAAGYVKNLSVRNAQGLVIGSKRIFSRVPEFIKADKPSPAVNHRGPEKAGVGDSHRGPENPGTEKTGLIKNNKDLFKKNNKKIYKKDFDKEFDEFWEQYPNKVDKHNAHEKYKKLLTTDYGLHAVILSALCIQNQQREIKAELGIWQAPPKGPAAWLNAKRWDDQDIKTREQLESESSKNRRAGNGQYHQNDGRSNACRPQSRLEARNNLIRNTIEEDLANARRVFEGGCDSEGGGKTEPKAIGN